MNVFASSPEGLENTLAKEILLLGGKEIKINKRLIAFNCDYSTFYKLHFFSKIAFRFYREIARFTCNDKNTLYKGVQTSFDWLNWLPVNQTFCVRVTGSTKLLRHSHFTALQVKNSIIDLQKSTFSSRSNISIDNPYLIIHLHLYNNEAVLSLQSTIHSLHKRGYRPAIGNAPLKENIASGLIQITDWDGTKPLIDLMCGSGTFLIEAISNVLQIPLNQKKNYLFENWLDFDQKKYLEELNKLEQNNWKYKKISKVIGCEIDRDVFNQAKENITRAKLHKYVEIINDDFLSFKSNLESGIIICNPPYGKKLGKEKELIDLYSKLGEFVKDKFSGWEFWMLSGNPSLTKYLKMKSSIKIPISNGGINCRWIKYLIR